MGLNRTICIVLCNEIFGIQRIVTATNHAKRPSKSSNVTERNRKERECTLSHNIEHIHEFSLSLSRMHCNNTIRIHKTHTHPSARTRRRRLSALTERTALDTTHPKIQLCARRVRIRGGRAVVVALRPPCAVSVLSAAPRCSSRKLTSRLPVFFLLPAPRLW